MIRVSVLALAFASLVAIGWSGSASFATLETVGGAGLHFPSNTPAWLVTATEQSARGLGDPKATLSDLRLGRFPVVVIRGNFRCGQCSRFSSNSPVATGHYVTLRFDAVTHHVHDFGLSPRSPGKLTALCSGDCRGRRQIAVDSAQQALDAAGIRVILGKERGQHRCLIDVHATERGAIEAKCGLTIVFGDHRTIVSYSETWTGLDRLGRRYSADSPVYTHVWRVIETPDGWVKSISSTGDRRPQ
jgi:hypothetical protein